MMNELFCYISEFLPDEIDDFSQQHPPQTYSPSYKTNIIETEEKVSKLGKNQKIKINQKGKKQNKANS